MSASHSKLKIKGRKPALRLLILNFAFLISTAPAQIADLWTINHIQQGLVGTYFNNINLTDPVLVRNHTVISFDWGEGSPDPLIEPDTFSVRWVGRFVAPDLGFDGCSQILARTDDGVRVWLDGQLIIDSWIDQPATFRGSDWMYLVPGTTHEIVMEYFENAGLASAQLYIQAGIYDERFQSCRPFASSRRILNFSAGAGDAFGSGLAGFGDGRFGVSAPKFDIYQGIAFEPNVDGGQAWVGDLTGTLQTHAPPTTFPISAKFYGASLAPFNGSLLVGSPGVIKVVIGEPGSPYQNVGTVYVGTSEYPNPTPTPASQNTYFGHTVAAASGNRFLASSLQGFGRVFLYSNSQPFMPLLVITNPTPVALGPGTPELWSGMFGSALAALGTNTLLIGSPRDSVTGDSAGSVYLYNYSGTQVRPKIHNPSNRAQEYFGATIVPVDNRRFLVGAPLALVRDTATQIDNPGAGLVYLYDDTGALLKTFVPPHVPTSGGFGTSITLLGPGRVLIGSAYDSVGGLAGAGRVHLFNTDGVHLETRDNPAPHADDRFGAAIAAMDHRRFVVGAPGDDTLQSDAGSAYAFDAPLPAALVGDLIPQPNGVNSSPEFQAGGPTVSPEGTAFWHVPSQKLFAVKPGGIMVSWPLADGGTYNWQASIEWPSNSALYQIHVAGQTTVDVGDSNTFSHVTLYASTAGADESAVSQFRRFSAATPGYSFLMLSSGHPSNNPIRFQFVQTIAANDPAHLHDNVPATVGEPIADPAGYHNPACGGPQVAVPGGIYCPPPVFDPATRTGRIIPVNKDNPATESDDLIVAFYQHGTRLYDPVNSNTVANTIGWPYKPVRFRPEWPSNVTDKIVIASQQGTGAINPAQFPDWQLYFQNDPNQAGFNPNDEHAMRLPFGTGQGVFALRSDLGTPTTSEPFVLIRHRNLSNLNEWRIKIWKVVAEDVPWFFQYEATAGVKIQPPFPLNTLPPVPESAGVSGPYWRDRKLSFWAKAAGDDGGPAEIVMRYFYRMQANFFYPGTNPPPPGESIPLLDLAAGTPGIPINVSYITLWPDLVPELRVAETLVKPKFGLPDISSQSSVEILYQQSVALGTGSSAKLIDPTREYSVPLAALPPDLATVSASGLKYFPDLPPHLRNRLSYDPVNLRLKFKGEFVEPLAGEYYLLLNVITAREKAIILNLHTDVAFRNAVEALAALTANVTEVPADTTGFDSLALTAGSATALGYVTVAFGNNTNLSAPAEPVDVDIIKVACPSYRGELKVLEPDSAFDEKLTLRHSGDFAGRADSYIFEWRTLPPIDGEPSPSPRNQWATFTPTPGNGQGAQDITIEGSGLYTLADNYFVCRYRPTSPPLCTNPTSTDPANPLGWSEWTAPMLAEGWVKRVLRGLNPFEQRFQSYQNNAIDKVVSMISQAGPPFVGPVALNQGAVDDFGLIEFYETLLLRARDFSIDGVPAVDYPPANDALLMAASRLADMYMLLGNEAYADAADPTIAFGTDNQVYGSEATSIHCFMNQAASLIEEELLLLRGRDDALLPSVETHPIYNRLIWNFTSDINGGEVAYALNYNIRDESGNIDGTISEADARIHYPQGHGDAWGHYLSAVKHYYRLLRNPNFTWVPRIEAVLVGGVAVSVDYLDERKFASAALARARTGGEIVNLTYRHAYVEDPSGQWQGYQDSQTNRAWGLAEWGSRAGQGTYLDWVTANALLPDVDINPAHTGIQKVDRTTITQLRDIGSALVEIQTRLDMADAGLNPLGLVKSVVPFDIDPTEIVQHKKTHFEQIFERSVRAMNNAIAVFNHANNSTQLLRRQADSSANFQQTATQREFDFNNRLIEVFGYPYPEDIGPSGAYPTGYDGPDIYHFDYVDSSELMGETPPPTQTFIVTFNDISGVQADGTPVRTTRNVAFNISSFGLGLVKPAGWIGRRRAPGQIQMSRSDMLQTLARFRKSLVEYKSLIGQIEDRGELVRAQHGMNLFEILVLEINKAQQETLNNTIAAAKQRQLNFQNMAADVLLLADALTEGFPKVIGFASDTTAALRAAVKGAAAFRARKLRLDESAAERTILDAQQAKELASLQEQITLTSLRNQQALAGALSELEVLIRQEALMRLELFTAAEALQQAGGRYAAALAAGERLLEERLRFRQQTAAQIQDYRYKDMAFRIFRNDALQKYRAQFDMAAMYVYLAARAYDYETNLREDDPRGPGQDFLTSIVRSRALGLIQDGFPQTGSGSGDPGLADALARMSVNWNLGLKGQLNFSNPQTETGRFSLRSELFRILPGSANSKIWRDTLSRNIVANLRDLPEFNRYCIPFQPMLAVEPAIVIPFSTAVNFGQNFFGWPLAGGDNNYDSTHFATKVASVGVWFANYNNLTLVNTPRVYLIPVGYDVMRSPSDNYGDIREWKIIDQKLPVPFPLSASSLSDPRWIPWNDTLPEQFADIRKFGQFRAYHDSGSFDPAQTINDSRLIGRSVWNTRWLLIIPGGSLLSDRNEGIQRFINGALRLDGTRDGNGVTDIKIFFQTYAYSGN